MRTRKFKQIKIKIHKNRTNKSTIHPIVKYGTSAICIKHNTRIEVKIIKYIKKYLKLRLRKKKWKKRIWQFLTVNYPVSKKSTNSRMGKGKGNFSKWILKLRSGSTLFEFKGFSPTRIQKSLRDLNKRLNLPLVYIKRIKKNKKELI